MEQQHLKISRENIFSPKIARGNSFKKLKNQKILKNLSTFLKANNNTINYYNPSSINFSNKNSLYISNNHKLLSPRKILKKSAISISQKYSKSRPKSSSIRKLFPSISQYMNITRNKFPFETEKLFQETNHLKKLIKELEKELFLLSNENMIKDEQITQKEKEINDIIRNNYNKFGDINDKYNFNINYNNYNFLNDLNVSCNTNSSMGVLMLKIKKGIKNVNDEIKVENDKLNDLKKSLYITKIKELNLESKLYKQQYNKINSLLENALKIKEENDAKIKEIDKMKENINKQELFISNFEKECIALKENELFLNNQLLNLKQEVKIKVDKAKKNKKELNILLIKNKNYDKDEIINSQNYTTKINGSPISIKCIYTNKVSKLKKNINFYKRQCKYSEDMINKLKEQRKKLIDMNKNLDQKIKIEPGFIEGTTKIKKNDRPMSSIGRHSASLNKDEDIINNLKKKYKAIREEEISLHQKANIFSEKLKEIDVNEERNEEENEQDQNEIEFGIDENNPFYTDNEENVPDLHMKFTSAQFNQFTYILFKNFEAKYIILDEANNKIINPFYDLIKKYNITNVNYPSEEFNTITEQFTKVIMKVLNSENEYNHTLTKMFVGALLCNSDYDTNKLVEFFSILFSYTRNYISEEKKLIEKLKTKYKHQTKKLIECIANHILNDISSSQYFSLFRMKDLLDENEINLKDKYIEFLFYYMKKFDDPDAKLEDLKFSLLNDIVPIVDTTMHSKAFVNDLFKELELDNNNDENLNVNGDINIEQKENKTTNIENFDDNIEDNIKEKKKDKKEKKKKDKNKDKKNKSKNSSKSRSKSKSKSKSKSNENTKDNINKSGTKNKDDIYNPNLENVKDVNIDDKKNKSGNNNNKENDIQIIKDNNNTNKYSSNLSDKINNDINIFRNDIKDNESKNDKNKINAKDNKDDNKTNNENNNQKKKASMNKYKEDEYVLNSSKNEENAKEEENNKTNEKDKLNNGIINNNDTNNNNEEDSITEITNDEYNKYIFESINQIQKAIKNKSTDFNELMKGVLNKMSVNGEFYEYINVEDFNEKMVSIGVTLSDLQLSCLCSRYCIPNELRLIDKLKFEKSLEDYMNGNLKI